MRKDFPLAPLNLLKPNADRRSRRRSIHAVAGMSAAILVLAGCAAAPDLPRRHMVAAANPLANTSRQRERLDAFVSSMTDAQREGPCREARAGFLVIIASGTIVFSLIAGILEAVAAAKMSAARAAILKDGPSTATV